MEAFANYPALQLPGTLVTEFSYYTGGEMNICSELLSATFFINFSLPLGNQEAMFLKIQSDSLGFQNQYTRQACCPGGARVTTGLPHVHDSQAAAWPSRASTSDHY